MTWNAFFVYRNLWERERKKKHACQQKMSHGKRHRTHRANRVSITWNQIWGSDIIHFKSMPDAQWGDTSASEWQYCKSGPRCHRNHVWWSERLAPQHYPMTGRFWKGLSKCYVDMSESLKAMGAVGFGIGLMVRAAQLPSCPVYPFTQPYSSHLARGVKNDKWHRRVLGFPTLTCFGFQ